MAAKKTVQANGLTEGRGAPFPEWAEQAFRMYVRGQRNWSAMGKMFGVDRRTARSNVEKWIRVVAMVEEASLVDARTEAIIGLEEIRSTGWQDHAKAGNNVNARTGALRLVMDAGEKIAAMRGVVTKREAFVDETPQSLEDQPLEVLVRIVKNGDGHSGD